MGWWDLLKYWYQQSVPEFCGLAKQASLSALALGHPSLVSLAL